MNITPVIPSLDISSNPVLLDLAQEVQATKKTRMLKAGGKIMAMLMPVGVVTKKSHTRRKTKGDYKAFLAAAGSWSDVDVEKFKKDMYRSRRVSISSSAAPL